MEEGKPTDAAELEDENDENYEDEEDEEYVEDEDDLESFMKAFQAAIPFERWCQLGEELERQSTENKVGEARTRDN